MADMFGGRYYPNGIGRERATSKDTLWLQLTPLKMVVDNINARVDNVSGEPVPSVEPMWFLMPSDFMFTIQHTWEELTTPASALRTIASKISTQGRTVKGTAGGTFEVGDKADNPHLYSNTARREFQMEFNFSVYNSTFNDVFLPVQNLVEYSCPEINSGFTEFTFPYIFSLQTVTGDGQSVDIVSIKKMAITSVQPAYKGPWIDGYPSSAAVQVSFVDLNPLYRSTLNNEKNKSITVRQK